VDRRYSLLPHIRSVINDDGGVLLDLNRGRCLSLNPVGGQIWTIIERHPEGLSAEGIVDELLLIYLEVEPDMLQRDVSHFLSELENKDLISNGNSARQFPSSSKKALPRLEHIISASLINESDKSLSGTFAHSQPISDEPGERGSFIYSLLAMLALIGTDLTLKIAGFPLLYRMIKRWPTRRLFALRKSSSSRICASVNAACRYYLKRTLCLQRSAITTCLLRLAGVPAQMVIAARIMPFQGHAWVEVNGKVINDRQRVQEFYSVLERC